MKWMVVKRADQDVVHIIPIGDFEPHDENSNCRCEPQQLEVDNASCDLLIHNAYDENGI